MTGFDDVKESDVQWLLELLTKDAAQGGYFVNPDAGFVRPLVRGLAFNQGRYGYMSCPCRLGTGDRARDLDIICPCDYRDPDLVQFGACYCGLYVSAEVNAGKRHYVPVPERRPPARMIAAATVGKAQAATDSGFSLNYPVWRCKVCGYLCAREDAPGQCPICKADHDRFERFL